jgi:ribonuclease HI
LVQALRYAKGKCVNIYTDSKCAFATLHMHGAIHKEKGLLTTVGNHLRWLLSTAEASKGTQTMSAEDISWRGKESSRRANFPWSTAANC